MISGPSVSAKKSYEYALSGTISVVDDKGGLGIEPSTRCRGGWAAGGLEFFYFWWSNFEILY